MRFLVKNNTLAVVAVISYVVLCYLFIVTGDAEQALSSEGQQAFLPIIGAAIGAIGGALGTASKASMIARQQAYINKRKRENEDWYNRRYNEDATQRADAQRLLTMTEEAIKRRNRAAEGRAAVMGGTEESVAAEKERNNAAMADVTSRIAAAGEARKDAIENQYLDRKDELEDKYYNLEGGKPNGFDYVSNTLGGAFNGLTLGLGNLTNNTKK